MITRVMMINNYLRAIYRLSFALISISLLSGDETPFPYENWENKDGKVLEARFERVKDAETVVLQVKNGGMRYEIKRVTLALESGAKITNYIEESKKTMLEAKRIEGADIYKAVALGLKADAETALVGKDLSLNVAGIRVDTNKLSAILELESGIYARLKLSGKFEFYELNKALYVRPTVKGSGSSFRYWWYNGSGSIDEGKLIAQEGNSWKFRFDNDVKLVWERVGVTDGVIITE
jgi:hypothetical protein